MKLRKIMTGIVASSLALSTLAVAASASSLKKAMKQRASPLQSMISTTQR